MKRYLALLRGVNVGGNNRVEMKKLKEIFETAGFSDVSTYINSGNVIFSGPDDKDEVVAAIKSILKENFPFDIQMIVRDSRSIRKLVKAIPADWQNDGKQKTDVLFLWDEYDNKDSLKLVKLVDGIDKVIYVSGALIWNLQVKDYGRSGMSKLVGTLLYNNVTVRNVNTVRKLGQLMG